MPRETEENPNSFANRDDLQAEIPTVDTLMLSKSVSQYTATGSLNQRTVAGSLNNLPNTNVP